MGIKINDKFQSITVVINDNYNSVYFKTSSSVQGERCEVSWGAAEKE